MWSRIWRCLLCLTLLGVLASCTGSTAQSHSTPCVNAPCTGSIDGAAYTIIVPGNWNGTLLLYSHGHRLNTGGARYPQLSPADTTGAGGDDVSKALLQQGYALAGSAYAKDGWATHDGVVAGEALYRRAVALIGRPQRTYVWGSSMGGLVTELLAEQNPSWVSGAAPMCGVQAGPELTFDLYLDLEVAVKALLLPGLKLDGFSGYAEANLYAGYAVQAIDAAAAGQTPQGAARILFIADLVGLSAGVPASGGPPSAAELQALAGALDTEIEFGLSVRYELEQQFGGNPSQNLSADYAGRITAAAGAQIAVLGGDVAAFEAALDAQPPIAAVSSARAALESSGDPSGQVRVPTITMHTVDDPLAIPASETILRDRAAAAGDEADLLQVFTRSAPVASAATGGSPVAGHCTFTAAQVVGLVHALNSWVSAHARPTQQAVEADVGAGVVPAYTPPGWPTGATR